jgi:mono/diheme cytochrome c family protein
LKGFLVLKTLKTLPILAIAAAIGLFAYAFVQPAVRAGSQPPGQMPSPAQSPGAENAQHATPPSVPDPGAAAYAKHCAICHGDQREGNLPAFPPLAGIDHRMTNDKIVALVHAGKGRMPAFPKLQGAELDAMLRFLATPAGAPASEAESGDNPSGLAAAGRSLFQQNCAFCHGRDAMGGETGPDLTQSKIVLSDQNGDKIAAVIREGRPDNKMPAFNFSSEELRGVVAFIHSRVEFAAKHKGSRRGVEVADLQTGNAQAGQRYFNGPGGCSKCHSPSGDLAGIANRYQGLRLEERMLYPRDAKSKVTVTLPSGEKFEGTLAYRDEFTIALRDSSGQYRSWPVARVHFTVDFPADAHVALFDKYTDDDVHNLMAYLQTLR